jgi:xanthine dehydrogenase iron-sulfur cluster and FAD-binding subunit A
MNSPARRMKQQPLPLKDMRATAAHFRASAERALVDSHYTPAEQQQRHAYYLQKAHELEAQRNEH